MRHERLAPDPVYGRCVGVFVHGFYLIAYTVLDNPLSRPHTTPIATAPAEVEWRQMMAVQNEDWVEWNGGDCPIPGHTLVEVQLGVANPEISAPVKASCWFWQHDPDAVNGDYHVTAYRVAA